MMWEREEHGHHQEQCVPAQSEDQSQYAWCVDVGQGWLTCRQC